jgi:hypothetical protein
VTPSVTSLLRETCGVGGSYRFPSGARELLVDPLVAVPLGGVVLWLVAQHLLGALQGVELPVVVGDTERAEGALTARRRLPVRSNS